jgi:hypothetical protein
LNQQPYRDRRGRRLCLQFASALLLTCTALPLSAAEYSFSGESNTLLRIRTTTDKKDLVPLYEYLRMNLSDTLKDGAGLSLLVGGWGRVDLGDRSGDRHTDGDLQYALLSYRPAKSNAVVNLGRQFVSEGVGTEKLDGLYLRSDLLGGLGAAGFIGKPVLTETDYDGADLVYGARLSHTLPKFYTVGLSALKNESNSSNRYRKEQGLDLWVHPHQALELTGRSSYNAVTSNWMEHTYNVTISPLTSLKLGAAYSNINYEDYFFNVTTKTLSLTNGILDPREKLYATSAWVAYTPLKGLTVKADGKNYNYEIAGAAKYYGASLALSLPQTVTAGAAFHRMEGDSRKLRYNEYRAYVATKFRHLDLAADLINIDYDESVSDVSNSLAVTCSAGYELSPKVRLGADLEYGRNPDFDNELRALMKVTYLFDTRYREGRDKGEK